MVTERTTERWTSRAVYWSGKRWCRSKRAGAAWGGVAAPASGMGAEGVLIGFL